MKPIPTKMRKRILDDCANGLSEVAAAEQHHLDVAQKRMEREMKRYGLDPKKLVFWMKPVPR